MYINIELHNNYMVGECELLVRCEDCKECDDREEFPSAFLVSISDDLFPGNFYMLDVT